MDGCRVDCGNWRAAAQCRGMELFVPAAEQHRAKRICWGCPVRWHCLAEALDGGIEFGIWGGMTERERRKVLRRNPDVPSWTGRFGVG